MEVLRNEYPKNNFLQKVKKLSVKYNKVLILMNALLDLESRLEVFTKNIMLNQIFLF